ncbi:hypothetical protein D9M70_644690 [compost metagenome]
MPMKVWVRLRASRSGVVRSFQSFNGTKATPALLITLLVRMSSPANVTTSRTAGCSINFLSSSDVRSVVRVTDAAGGRK